MPLILSKIIKMLKSSVIGIKETHLRHLSDGKPLGMFPAGKFQLTRWEVMVDGSPGRGQLK
jgi:hypothetical protein